MNDIDQTPSAALPNKLSIDEAIDLISSGRFQRRILFAAGLAFWADAGEIMLLSFLTVVLAEEWNLSSAASASIFSSVFGGMILGTLVLGPLADRFGRRPIFLLASALIAVFGLLTAAAQSMAVLLAVRLLVGVGIGGLTVPFDVLAELSPQANRGRNLIVIQFFGAGGSLLVAGLAAAVLDASWRLLAVLAAVPVLVSLVIGYRWIPESPRWLLAQGKHDQALAVLRQAARTNGLEVDLVLPPSSILVDTAQQTPVRAQQLLLQPWRKTTLLLWITWAGFAFAYYGSIQLTTELFSSLTATSVGFDYTAIAIATSAKLVGLLAVLVTIDRIGRVPTQVIAYVGGGLGVLAFALLAAYQQSHVAQVILAFLVRAMLGGGSAVTWLYTGEVLPTGFRATGHSAASFMARLGGFAAPYLITSAASLAAVVGPVLCVVSLITAGAVAVLPETMGLTLGTAVSGVVVADKEEGEESCKV